MRLTLFLGCALLSLSACGGAPEPGHLFIDSLGDGAFEGTGGAGFSDSDIKKFVELDVCRSSGKIGAFSSSTDDTGVITFSGQCA